VARRVGNDEFAPRRGEVAVGHVDRDALLALRAEAVRQQRQVHLGVAAPPAGLLDRRVLILEDALGVEEQPPDERALAVVDGSGRGEAQQIHQVPAQTPAALLRAP
jgi:hypothetical protein